MYQGEIRKVVGGVHVAVGSLGVFWRLKVVASNTAVDAPHI